VVERTMIRPPSARLGLVSADERNAIITGSPLKGKYDTEVHSESAEEVLGEKIAGEADETQTGGWIGRLESVLGTIFGTTRKRGERLTPGQRVTRNVTRTVAGSAAGELGKRIGGRTGGSILRAIVQGLLGGRR
jgi:DNA double-strand break repair helicase HerA and related ATPase